MSAVWKEHERHAVDKAGLISGCIKSCCCSKWPHLMRGASTNHLLAMCCCTSLTQKSSSTPWRIIYPWFKEHCQTLCLDLLATCIFLAWPTCKQFLPYVALMKRASCGDGFLSGADISVCSEHCWWKLRCWITAWSCFYFRFKHLTFNRNLLCLFAHRCLFRLNISRWSALFFLRVREIPLCLWSSHEINLTRGLIRIKEVQTVGMSHIISLGYAASWGFF